MRLPGLIVFLLSLIGALTVWGDTIYVATDWGGAIQKFDQNGNGSILVSNLNLPSGLALDRNGNLLVAEEGNNRILYVDPTGGTSVAFDGLNTPTGIAFDTNGNLFVANYWGYNIMKIAGDGTKTTFTETWWNHPNSMAFDKAGNLYVAFPNGNVVVEYHPDGSSTIVPLTGLNLPSSVAFDQAGNLYVASSGNNLVYKYSTGGVQSVFAAGFYAYPTGLAFDSSGNLYVADHWLGNDIIKVDPSGNETLFANTLDGPAFILIKATPPSPTIVGPAAQTVECGTPATVTAQVGESDGAALAVVWALNGILVQTNLIPAGPAPTMTNVSFTAELPLGTNLIKIAAANSSTNTASCSTTVTVVDTTPPVVQGASASPDVLWPPNHKMVTVTVNATVTDTCGPATWKITSVQSNVPVNGTGDGITSPDWQILGDHSVALRAERSGDGSGRIYSITLQAEDVAGNFSTPTVVNVTVPRSMGK